MSGKPLALFTGGPIGAGKSLLATHLAQRLQLVVLDLDDLTAHVASLRPARPFWESRPTALRLLECWQAKIIAAKTPVLVATTARDGPFTLALEARYRDAGYATAMVFVDAPDALCRQRNAARACPRPEEALDASLTGSRGHLAAYRQAFGALAHFTNSGDAGVMLEAADRWAIAKFRTGDRRT